MNSSVIASRLSLRQTLRCSLNISPILALVSPIYAKVHATYDDVNEALVVHESLCFPVIGPPRMLVEALGLSGTWGAFLETPNFSSLFRVP